VLRAVSLIAAEDARRAAILLSHFDLHTPSPRTLSTTSSANSIAF
jgi:16S rRNA C1402 (ribose-2'-O) methylase RsmI